MKCGEVADGGARASAGEMTGQESEGCVAPTVLEILGTGTERLRAGLDCGAPLALNG